MPSPRPEPFNPFDLTRSPLSTPAVEEAIAGRRAREDEAAQLVECVSCGEHDVDHGERRPLCRVCARRRVYGTAVDVFVSFFFGGRR